MIPAPRIVVVGEALVDVVPGAGGATELPGGSPANVAVTLGRLGWEPQLVTVLADDDRGGAVRTWLEASGVRVNASLPASGRTSAATVALDATGGATYEFDLSWDPDPDALLATCMDAQVVHVGSIATVMEPGAAAVERAVRSVRGRALLSFDPNARPTITPDVREVLPGVERLVTICDVVKVSAEDLEWYFPGVDALDAARQWAASGPALVIVTRGADGAVAVRGTDVVWVPGVRVDVVDTIGAGDTFSGALIDALVGLGATGSNARAVIAGLTRTQIATVIAWAAHAAAVTVSRAGANPPTRRELTAWVTL